MIEIKDGHVYETVEVVTTTQTAIVTTHKCAEYKVKLSFINGILTAQYMDWQDNLIISNKECVLRISNYLTGQTQKLNLQFINGIITYPLNDFGEYQITASVIGTDGDNIFVEII